MATNRIVYHVTPDGKGWQVTREGQTVLTTDRKDQALADARLRAKAEQPSQVVIHTADGKIESEATYQDDPFPPRG